MFLAVVLVISAATAGYVIAWIGRKLKHRPEPSRSALAKWTRRDVLGLAGGGLACIAWGGFYEPYRLEVTRTRIVSPKLRGADRPVRIVQISDLHCDPTLRNEPKLPGLIAPLKPDIIVYTGDSINSIEGLPNFRNCLAEIAQIAPVYATRGNWDVSFGPRINYFGQPNVTELDGSNQLIEAAGTRLWVAGIKVLDAPSRYWDNDLSSEERLDNALAGIPEEDFKVFLYHYPDEVNSLADRGVDLHCAGHTHGGQVAMPFYGALVTVSKFGKKYEAGLYSISRKQPQPDMHLYVNRGIGMEGYAPRVRFWCRPEISLIELAPPGSPATDKHG
ncbi:MAG: metallophosphoesterase [Phycisphaerae bacterium]|nr:metallophosphoesterase [Phycisphaerae bacterium]